MRHTYGQDAQTVHYKTQTAPAFSSICIPPGVLPFALPAAARDVLQGRVEAVSVVADVTLITQKEASRVTRLATRLTHRTLQTPPAFTQHHFRDLHTHES